MVFLEKFGGSFGVSSLQLVCGEPSTILSGEVLDVVCLDVFIGDFLEGSRPANIGMEKGAFEIATEPVIQPLEARQAACDTRTTLAPLMVN